MLIVRDSLLFGSLIAAMLVVYAIDQWDPRNVAAGVGTPLTSNGIPTPTDYLGTSSKTGTEADQITNDEFDRVEKLEAEQARTGIIDSFEPYTPRIIAEASPPPPSLVIVPAPQPPALVELAEPPQAPAEAPPPVRFFETEARAQSVGYVVDCSSSMEGEKFQAVCLKLAESIMHLKRDQGFHVVFFSDSFYPMTGSASPKLVPADSDHKRSILGFLSSARANGGTNPEPALRFMTAVDPDIVYLLTDGEFSPLSESTYQGFKDANIVVHTLGFETGSRVAILDEIARRTGGTYQPAARGPSSAGLLFSPAPMVKKGLSSRNPDLRSAAVFASIVRGLPFLNDLIDLIGDVDLDLQGTIQDHLVEEAAGSDFGPADADDVEDAKMRWKLWRTLRNAQKDRLLQTLGAGDPNACWVAASIIRSRQLDVPDELIAAMRSSPPGNALAEIHASLLQCSGGEDFGPAVNATSDEIATAAGLWQAWRDAALAREAVIQRERRVERAAQLLRQAKNLIGVNDEAVERRYRELVADYGDTPAGEEARILLGPR